MRLVVKKSDRTVKEYNLDKGKAYIGRLPSCEICLDDKTVSRKHAIIASSNDKIVIKDLGSSNKSYLNGKPIKKCVFKSGDKLTIADYCITLSGNGKENLTPDKPSTEKNSSTKTATGIEDSSIETEKNLLTRKPGNPNPNSKPKKNLSKLPQPLTPPSTKQWYESPTPSTPLL